MRKYLINRFGVVMALILLFMHLPFVPTQASESVDFIFAEQYQDGQGVFSKRRYVDANGNEVDLTGGYSHAILSYSAHEEELPSSYDSRDYGYVTSVKSQGNSANCWAFSTISALESDSIIKGIDSVETADYSEAHLAWFNGKSFTENEEDPTYGDGYNYESPFLEGGSWEITAVTLSRGSGLAEESEYPFYPYNLSAMGNYNEADRYNTSAGVTIESAQGFSDTTEIKHWIIDHGSITAGIYYDDGFLNSETYAHYTTASGLMNHQITIVGWDDNYSVDNFYSTNAPEGNGAWLCKNSWTEHWGNDGYFWVSYYDASLDYFAGFTTREADYYKNYTYNGVVWNSAYSRKTATQLANVFTASGNELLSAISTYTIMENVNVKATIYKNLRSNYYTPTEGTKAATLEMTLEKQGYHTIYLDEEIALNPGEIFSVVLELSHDSGSINIPVEYNGQTDMKYACKDKQSFINLNAAYENWQDAQFYDMQNVYIQAFTKCNHQYETSVSQSTCISQGSEVTACVQCGDVESEILLPIGEHRFSKWSHYIYDEETGRNVSTRSCDFCGEVHSKSIGANKIMLEDFLEMIFSRIEKAIRLWFMIT
ncbi:MAG: hypothetical protein E7547_05050 [Ruminococcaceae bacterium]|nr:hypothetical protein [Oscillospiraceae bacterium]